MTGKIGINIKNKLSWTTEQ